MTYQELNWFYKICSPLGRRGGFGGVVYHHEQLKLITDHSVLLWLGSIAKVVF